MAVVPPALRKALRFWEIPFLAALASFMLWVRMLPYDALVGQGRAYFIGTDPFYHYRATLGIVRAFPAVPRYDPWTFYPHGTVTGQFASLFDWAAAAFVVLTEGKGASEAYVQQVLGAYPAFLGALLVIPFYFLAKRLIGTPGAIVASITLALLPGEFLIRSIAGYSDHHVAEALMSVVAILGFHVAATHGHAARAALMNWRADPSWRRALVWGLVGGVALAANLYTWPPALLFLAILAAWLTIVILHEDGWGSGDAHGYAFGGSVAFVTAGLLMAPSVETTFLGEFNTYGLLHVLAPLAAGAWLWIVHLTSRATRKRHRSPWIVPGVIAALGLATFVAIQAFARDTYASILWGLSWVTGIGVQRTTMTIAEARPARFFCSADAREYSCLATDFGVVAPVAFLVFLGVIAWVLIKRRREDVLIAIWAFVAFRATQTQIRFSYYAAVVMALLIGWLAARVSETSGLDAALAGRAETEAPAPAARGRKTKRAEARTREARPWQAAAVAAVLLLVLPGNVFATDTTRPGWESADIRGADGDLVLWLHGLDWMRNHTPQAGVDLGLVIPRPSAGQIYEYPDETYGVLSWWDYGHWIETVALRPPVANPFQQAAPFAAAYFTERDPARAETLLDEWVLGKGPIRYVWIDDEMASGKYGAITVWAKSQNESRAQWGDGQYVARATYQTPQGARDFLTTGPEWHESMMARLYDEDAFGLGHYRLVWEAEDYIGMGTVANADGGIGCLHDRIPWDCRVDISADAINNYQPGTAVALSGGAHAYDLKVQSRLKLFERVEGAKLVGTAQPGETVTAATQIQLLHGEGRGRSWTHEVSAVAGPDGRFEIVWPYPTTGFLSAEEGGTDAIAKPTRNVIVARAGASAAVDVSERAVLDGHSVDVTF